ncbi:MAG: hydrogenase maturation protease [Solirubrobacterales bacterium]
MSLAPGWEQLESTGRTTVEIDGREIGRGSRVVLRPGASGDIFDRALAGQTAVVEAVLEDTEGAITLTVTVDSDPGQDLGIDRRPGHRFFFTPAEIEPLAAEADAARTRILVAGIGNLFMAYDGFGVELARRLAERGVPDGVEVKDLGIRGMDLVYALGAGYDAVVLLDATPRGEEPGTVYVIEPDVDEDGPVSLDTHGMDPVKVMRLARELGPVPDRLLVVGCEPEVQMTGEEEDVAVALSEPVRAALDEAEKAVDAVLAELLDQNTRQPEGGTT